MNASSAQNGNQVGTKEFLDIVEKFNHLCSKGENLPIEDVNAFYEVISSTKIETGKDLSHSSFSTDPSMTEKTSQALHELQATLGNNKAVIETTAKSISIEIRQAVDRLTFYVDAEQKKKRSVSRKDTDQMPSGKQG